MNVDRTLWWDHDRDRLELIDQTLLPCRYESIAVPDVEALIEAIRVLRVRGAPALGAAGAYGVALAARTAGGDESLAYLAGVRRDAARIRSARPTAVNLAWGVDRALAAIGDARTPDGVRAATLAEAERIADEDAAMCRAIGTHGAALLPDPATVLTHCNAGALACVEWGTALGVVRSAVEAGKKVSVIACETRPLLQGARLSAFELRRDDIPVTVCPDSAAAHLMRSGGIDAVVVGADRICRDAVFNKIGTYAHAIAARYHGIPFYVAAPSSTLDFASRAAEIEIEERGRDEVASSFGVETVPPGVPVRNPAFDATPFALVTAVITERGVYSDPGELFGS
ncbi:MAG: S-methyl-5-thioribose-1-phosphate isomerase [Methanospirillum sp.]|nr:S-methyl-5-thioribose-1-phosphate isomerase [Methanospirillum sp.]